VTETFDIQHCRRPSPLNLWPLPPQRPDVITAPLWDVAAQGAAAFPSNAEYVQQFVTNLLATSFPNLRPQQVQVRQAITGPPALISPSCAPPSPAHAPSKRHPSVPPPLRPPFLQATVLGMMQLREFPTFKQHVRDFLVQSNQFADQNNADLFTEEVAAQVGRMRGMRAVRVARGVAWRAFVCKEC
jgi:exportin-1